MNIVVRGVSLEISYIFTCAVTLFIALDRTGMFVPLMISVLAHETAHLIVISFYRCKIKGVKLKIGTVSIDYVDTMKPFERIFALISGPLANLFLAVVLYCFELKEYSAMNFVLSFYNLIPVKGLDGGDILNVLLSFRLNSEMVNKILRIVGFIIILLTIALFVVLLKMKVFNYSLLLFCLYLMLTLV